MVVALQNHHSFKAGAALHDPSGADVLEFALAERREGREAAVASLARVDGASPRRIGAQMAVAEDGRFVGSISSGCVERAIAAEAVAAMGAQHGRSLRYGAGSPFRDIILPCGSGIDILVSTPLDADVLGAALDALNARRPAALDFVADGCAAAHGEPASGTLRRAYVPRTRLVIAGVGAETVVLSRMAEIAGMEVHVMPPEDETLERAAGVRTALRSTAQTDLPTLDPWSAFVLLFHDRDWETPLAAEALKTDAFFTGAVGGARTHAMRREALKLAGVPEGRLDRLRGPIGLVPSTRDPSALAVSILAEIVAEQPA
ncbi:MAG: XdhC family protein [Pseudomonadota bacterium]